MKLEQILSLLSIVGLASGLGAIGLVNSLRTALKTSREIIDSLTTDLGTLKGRMRDTEEKARQAEAELLATKARADLAEKSLAEIRLDIELLRRQLPNESPA
jgi:chromosome segregation ATPase